MQPCPGRVRSYDSNENKNTVHQTHIPALTTTCIIHTTACCRCCRTRCHWFLRISTRPPIGRHPLVNPTKVLPLSTRPPRLYHSTIIAPKHHGIIEAYVVSIRCLSVSIPGVFLSRNTGVVPSHIHGGHVSLPTRSNHTTTHSTHIHLTFATHSSHIKTHTTQVPLPPSPTSYSPASHRLCAGSLHTSIGRVSRPAALYTPCTDSV